MKSNFPALVRCWTAVLAGAVILQSNLLHLSSAAAAPGLWSQGTEMPAPASATCGCVVDGILYVIGGLYPYPGLPLNTVWAYDPQAQAWTRKADMPTARRFLAATSVEGIIYVVGGTTGDFDSQAAVGTVEAYDPKADTWTTKANMPTPRGMLGVCAVDGIIYSIAGLTGAVTNSHAVSTVEAYDPRADNWTTRKSLPRACHFLTASAVGGMIFAFQGSQAFAYDPRTDLWTTKASFSPWSWGLMSTSVEGVIYLFGGMNRNWSTAYDFAMAYDPAQDCFTPRRKMPRTRLLSACGSISGKVYLAGGVSVEPVVNDNPTYYQVVDVFDPQSGIMPQFLSGSPLDANHFQLIWQAQPGIKYAVESTTNTSGAWTRLMLPTGTTVTATNEIVETSCPVPTGETKRFFRVFESD